MTEELRNTGSDDLMTADHGELVAANDRAQAVAIDNQRQSPAVDDQPDLVAVNNRSRNEALVSFVLLPMLFLTVTLLGGLRVNAADRAFVFVPPPLITLVLAVLLLLLF